MNNLSFESMKNLVGTLDKQRFVETPDFSAVTYSIPTNPEYWGNDCSDMEAIRSARIVADEIRKKFPDVSIRFVYDTMGFGNRSTGPAELIEEIDDYCENWGDWVNQSEGLDRVWLDHPVYGKETIGEWLERQGVKQTEDGKFIFYHGTPKVGGATDSLREGSYLGFSEDFSRHQAQRDRDIGEEDVIVHELHLSPDDINPGVHPTLRKPIEIEG